MTGLQSLTKASASFYEYQNHILNSSEIILKRFQKSFEAEIGELQNGSSVVVHS